MSRSRYTNEVSVSHFAGRKGNLKDKRQCAKVSRKLPLESGFKNIKRAFKSLFLDKHPIDINNYKKKSRK
jgi:hypothetical protein